MKLKRIFSLVLSASMLFAFAACSKETNETTVATTTAATTTAATETSIEETETTVAETEPVIEDINGLYDPTNPLAVNPVTGLQDMDPANIGYRSIAIVINNKYEAQPQRGVSQADAIYEYETEGGQTRLLAVFADINTVPEVGSLRSARILSTDLAAGNNSIFIHYGRNARVPDHIAEWGIDHVDGNNCSAGPYSSANGEVNLPTGLFFWRDSVWKSYRALEHTAVSDGKYISAAIDYFDIERQGETPLLFNYVPDNSANLANGENCTSLNVWFSQTNDDALFTYDEASKLYLKSQYGGMAQIDETTGEQIAVTNVIVCFAEIHGHGDGTIDAYLENGGTGYYASNGKIIPIFWSKNTPTDLIVLTDIDGNEIEVNRGKSYICIVDNDYIGNTTYN
ncbi:MAG: DUF3048 domain-containing protein [Clostridia bacterium]|nr:DUF3048 domain-containing protein [Clostridia bacterium]